MTPMRISVAADHNGYELKNEISETLKRDGHDVIDMGPHYLDPSDDYPDYAKPLAESVSSGETERGIMVCGSGVGASVAANKVKGVRAAVCHDIYSAHQGVEHDDMNVLCLGSRIVGTEVVRELVSAFISAEYTNEERHARRLTKVIEMENDFS
ncbi:MAG TPA: ribose 5-phosphate isomerase B [Dehalococcoidia bacterium]|nr:ribose 5-phosphate isomerase B [Dehalococcoidia bacterium]